MTTISWENAVDGDWSDASNWTPNTVPDRTTDVVISGAGAIVVQPCGCPEPTPYDITLSLATTIRSLTLDGPGAVLDANDARLIVRKGLVNNNTLDIENRSFVSVGTSLINNGLLELDETTGSHGSRLAIGGNLVNNDTFV